MGRGSPGLLGSGLQCPDTPSFQPSWLEGEWGNQCQTFFKPHFWWMSSFHSLASKTWYGFGQRHGKMWLLRFGEEAWSFVWVGRD